MNRKAFVFSVEALLSLVTAVALLALVSTNHRDLGFDSLARNALAQDLLETSVKQKTTAETLYAFAAGDDNAKRALSKEWGALLSQTGAVCFKLEAGSGALETACGGEKKFSAAAAAALFDGTRWTQARLTLYFAS